MKFAFRISGAYNFEILVDDSNTGNLSSITFRIECLFAFQSDIVTSVWKIYEREGRKYYFVNSIFL